MDIQDKFGALVDIQDKFGALVDTVRAGRHYWSHRHRRETYPLGVGTHYCSDTSDSYTQLSCRVQSAE